MNAGAWYLGYLIIITILLLVLLLIYLRRERPQKHPLRRSQEPTGPRAQIWGERERERYKITRLRIVRK